MSSWASTGPGRRSSLHAGAVAGVEFRELDLHDIGLIAERFDGVLCLLQSFGYGESDQNRALLAAMRHVLRPGGRILLDIYNADAVEDLPSSEVTQRWADNADDAEVRSGCPAR